MIAKEIETSLNRSSWIRRVFDQGHELKKEFGAENVFDFSLGNPVVEPPKEFAAGIKSILEDNKKGKHRYMLNAGLDEVREYVAQELAEDFNLPIKKEQVVMTVGAGGALNVIFKSILNAGDEVLAFAPYFMEYEFYVSNHGGRLKVSKTDANFQPNLENFKKDLTYEVRAVLVNSPNNPTGVVYNQEKIDGIVKIIQEAEKIYGHPIYLISDEPYRSLIYDQSEQGSVLNAHEHSVLVTSHSKDYGLAGERIGYIAVNPLMKDWKKLIAGLIFSTRILGFVNAPALMQRVLPYLKTANTSKDHYQELRDITVQMFRDLGYEFVVPQGAFFIFPKSPLADEVKFVELALKHRILLVPGRGFGCEEHFRFSYSVEKYTLERSKTQFLKLQEDVNSYSA